jgi:hypothetical protein
MALGICSRSACHSLLGVWSCGEAVGSYVDVLPRRKSLKGAGMMDPDVTMKRERSRRGPSLAKPPCTKKRKFTNCSGLKWRPPFCLGLNLNRRDPRVDGP